MYFRLAWRNLWRNKRRTFITMGSIFFAVILSTLMMSFKEGSLKTMVDSMVGSFTGYAQIHQVGYWDDKTLDNSMSLTSELKSILDDTDGLTGHMARVESFALAPSSELTKGAMVVGVDAEKEQRFGELESRVVEGEFLNPNDKAVLMGVGLAEFLRLEVGDTLVLISQGYHGMSAAGKYPIKGLVKFGSPELSKQLVFLPLKESQWLYGLEEDMVTTLVLIPEDESRIGAEVKALRKKVSSDYEVMSWKDLNPELVKLLATERMEGYVFMFILYLVISFGIFGTVLMMLAERQHEFGVMVAVGMKRFKLSLVVLIEVVIISLLGAVAGVLGALPICWYYYLSPIRFGGEYKEMMEEYGMEPILGASIDPWISIEQAAVVGGISVIIALYPFFKVLRMNALESMRT